MSYFSGSNHPMSGAHRGQGPQGAAKHKGPKSFAGLVPPMQILNIPEQHENQSSSGQADPWNAADVKTSKTAQATHDSNQETKKEVEQIVKNQYVQRNIPRKHINDEENQKDSAVCLMNSLDHAERCGQRESQLLNTNHRKCHLQNQSMDNCRYTTD